jgi:hypothetical protein
LYRSSVVILLLLSVGLTIVGTGAFTVGDQAVDGVFLNPADSQNGDAYAEINDQGDLRVELTNLNPQATTTVDDVFTISTTNHRSRVWIEHDAGQDVSFYRSDTDTPIGGQSDLVVLRENETVPVGLRIDAGSETVVLTRITVRAEIRPTATDAPTTTPTTTVSAGPGPSTPAPTPEPTPVPTAPPTATQTPTPEQPTSTAAPTTVPGTTTEPTPATPTTTPPTATPTPPTEQPTTSPTDDGPTTTDSGGPTPDGTIAPSTTAPSTTATPTTSPPPTTAPATTAPPDDESPTQTASTPTTEPDDEPPTATALPPETTAPPQDDPGTTVAPGVTVSTPDDGDTEIGGFSPVQLGGAVAALAALALGLVAWGLLGSSSALVLVADAGDGLAVRPQSLTDDWYDTREDGFAFRFAETDTWVEAAGEGPVTFERAVTVTNTGNEAARVTVPDAESLSGVGLSADGVDLTAGGFVLDGGESADLTLELPAEFDPDGEVTVRFRRAPTE